MKITNVGKDRGMERNGLIKNKYLYVRQEVNDVSVIEI